MAQKKKAASRISSKKKKTKKTMNRKAHARAVKKVSPQKKKALAKPVQKKPVPKRPDGIPERLKKAALKVLDERQAENILTVDLRGKSAMADYALIATSRSSRQSAAIADHLQKAFETLGIRKIGIEGLPQGDWTLIDVGDVIVHLFLPEVRRYYNLEDIWRHKPRRA